MCEGEFTPHLKDQAALERRIEELTDFIENASVPLHWVDENGIIIWANQAELDTFGYSRDEYIGFPISDFHADQETIDDILNRLSKNEVLMNYRAKLKCKDGSIKHVLINSSVFRRDEKFVHTRCFTRDITLLAQEEERKGILLGELEKSEASLKEAIASREEKSARLAAIIESSDDAIVSKTLEGIVTSWNGSAERIFGYTEAEMIGQSILKIIPQDRLDEEVEILTKLGRGERVEHFETKRQTKQGNLIDLSLTISPIKDKNGRIIGVSKIARDITERKLEEQRKDAFVAMASHELKTPLTAITAYLQLMLVKSRRDMADFYINTLTRAEAQAKKMITMIQDFLSVARLEEGKIVISKQNFDLQPLISEIIDDASFLTTRHQICFKGPDHIHIYGDQEKISHVLMNLVNNAVKYSPNGGTITISVEPEADKVKISVSDEGVGIHPKDRRRLFERFYRVDNEKTQTAAGFGIGLYLASEILRYHDSKIELESQEGVGSTFWFYLPVYGDS